MNLGATLPHAGCSRTSVLELEAAGERDEWVLGALRRLFEGRPLLTPERVLLQDLLDRNKGADP